VLVSAISDQTDGFNPLISNPVSETKTTEPPYDYPGWFPANMWAVNHLGDEALLVVVPAQFDGNQDSGTLRRFTALDFQVYYTTTASPDWSSPIIWLVESLAVQQEADFWVTTQDTSGIQRVVIVYTQDGIHWQSQDLYDSGDTWHAQLTGVTHQFAYLVQVVDGAGNVTVTSNKGLFFELTRHEIYLPVVMRN
jgi:ureidoglycolate hydrolase